MVDDLLPHVRGRAFIADSAYDADRIIGAVRERGMKPVVNMNPTRKHNRRRLDRKLYRQRYLIEMFFHHLKRFRAIATRYEKTAQNYLALVQLGCIILWLN
jgi:transposase